MKTNTRTAWATGALALALIGSSAAAFGQGYQGYHDGPPPPGQYGYRGGWDAAPQEFRDVQRQGFQDGIQGARRDFDNHRRPNPNNRDEFRHPHVPRSVAGDYREGFRRGYDVAWDHIMHERPR